MIGKSTKKDIIKSNICCVGPQASSFVRSSIDFEVTEANWICSSTTQKARYFLIVVLDYSIWTCFITLGITEL
jgi:hypothetical protein